MQMGDYFNMIFKTFLYKDKCKIFTEMGFFGSTGQNNPSNPVFSYNYPSAFSCLYFNKKKSMIACGQPGDQLALRPFLHTFHLENF